MKTFALIDKYNFIKGIGMVYFEDGSLSPEVQQLVHELGLEEGLKTYGEKVNPDKDNLRAVVIDTLDLPSNSTDDEATYDKTWFESFKVEEL